MADAPFCGSFRHDSVTNRYPKKKGRYTHSTIGAKKSCVRWTSRVQLDPFEPMISSRHQIYSDSADVYLLKRKKKRFFLSGLERRANSPIVCSTMLLVSIEYKTHLTIITCWLAYYMYRLKKKRCCECRHTYIGLLARARSRGGSVSCTVYRNKAPVCRGVAMSNTIRISVHTTFLFSLSIVLLRIYLVAIPIRAFHGFSSHFLYCAWNDSLLVVALETAWNSTWHTIRRRPRKNKNNSQHYRGHKVAPRASLVVGWKNRITITHTPK